MVTADGRARARRQAGLFAYVVHSGVTANVLVVAGRSSGLDTVGNLDHEVSTARYLQGVSLSAPYPGKSTEGLDESIIRRVERRMFSSWASGRVHQEHRPPAAGCRESRCKLYSLESEASPGDVTAQIFLGNQDRGSSPRDPGSINFVG